MAGVDAVEHPVDMGLGFGVKDNLFHADIQKLVNKVVLRRDHHMAVKGQPGFGPELPHRVQTQRHTGAEMAVQDIHMEHFDAVGFQKLHVPLQIAQVQADEGRRIHAGLFPNRFHPWHASSWASISSRVGMATMAPFRWTQRSPAALP